MKKKYISPKIEIFSLEVEEGLAANSNINSSTILLHSGNSDHNMENLFLENYDSAIDGSSSSSNSIWF